MSESQPTEVVRRSDAASANVLDHMRTVGRQLESLRWSVADADPNGAVARMMRCSWFGELVLAFPQVDAIRVSLVASDDKSALSGAQHAHTHTHTKPCQPKGEHPIIIGFIGPKCQHEH